MLVLLFVFNIFQCICLIYLYQQIVQGWRSTSGMHGIPDASFHTAYPPPSPPPRAPLAPRTAAAPDKSSQTSLSRYNYRKPFTVKSTFQTLRFRLFVSEFSL